MSTGHSSIAIGYEALGSDTIANHNVEIGVDTLADNVAAD